MEGSAGGVAAAAFSFSCSAAICFCISIAGFLTVVLSLITPCLSLGGAPKLFNRFSTLGGSGGTSFGTGTIIGALETGLGTKTGKGFDDGVFLFASFGGGNVSDGVFGNFEKSNLEISGATGFGAMGASGGGSGAAGAGAVTFAGGGVIAGAGFATGNGNSTAGAGVVVGFGAGAETGAVAGAGVLLGVGAGRATSGNFSASSGFATSDLLTAATGFSAFVG